MATGPQLPSPPFLHPSFTYLHISLFLTPHPTAYTLRLYHRSA